jgi:hypothetical protein
MREDPTFRRWAALAALGALATAGCFFADEPRDNDEGDDDNGTPSGWSTPGAARPGIGGDEAGGAGGASAGGTLSRGGASAGGSLTTGGTSAGGASAGGAGPAGGTSAGGSPAGGTGGAPSGGSPAGGASAGGTISTGGAFPTGGTGGAFPTGGTNTGGTFPTGGTTTGGTGGTFPTGGTGGTGSGAVMKFCNDLARGTESVTLTLSFNGVRASAASGTCTPVVPNACIPIPTGADPSVILLEGSTEILAGTFVGFTVAPGDEIFVLATFDDVYMEPTLLADTFELVFGTSCASTDPYAVTPSPIRSAL